jgi:hypothetical protein
MVKGVSLVVRVAGSELDPRAVIKTAKGCHLTREQSMTIMEIAKRHLHGIKEYGGPTDTEIGKSGEARARNFILALNVENEPDALHRFAMEVQKITGIFVQEAGFE